MSVIAFANPKGGTGKTTSALLLAETFASAGARVAILDCDPNRNLISWQEERQRDGRTMPFTVFDGPTEDKLIDAIDELANKFDYVVIDLEGTAAQVVTFALTRADLAVIPLEPNSVEAKHAARAVGLITRTEKVIRGKIPYTLLFNRTNAAFETREEADVRAETTASSINVLPVSLVRRSAYTKIFGETATLQELYDAASGTKDKSQLEKAIANARQYATAVADLLDRKEDLRVAV